MMHTERIRCNYCGRRIPASSVVCPNCQRNPRAFYWKRGQVLLLLVFAACALGAAAWWFGDDLNRALGVNLALNATPALTRSPVTATRAPATAFVVATRPPATATRVPPTATRVPPSPTVRPTSTPTSTFTSTRVPRTPEGTDTPTLIPTMVPVAAPKLLAPGDGERVIGPNKRVLLTFQPAAPLGGQEWYRVQVDYLDRSGQPVSWCEFTRESALEFPRDFFDDSSPNVRSFLWRVHVVRSNQISPKTCDAPYDVLSAPSEVWTFYWY